MTALRIFPVDELNLILLAEACRPGDDGRSRLSDFLKMGGLVATRTVTHDADGNPMLDGEALFRRVV